MIKRIPSTFSKSFSEVVVVDMGLVSTIYVSGHVGMDASGKVTAKTYDEEARLCFDHVRKSLEKVGASMKDVVRITAYLTDLADYAGFAIARGEAFPNDPPASAAVQVSGLLVNARLEIDAIAVVKNK